MPAIQRHGVYHSPKVLGLKIKGNSGEIRTGVPYKLAAAPDGQPVGCLSAAAPGYHYTLDHLLSLDPPRAEPLNQR